MLQHITFQPQEEFIQLKSLKDLQPLLRVLRTIGGAFNLISTPIPTDASGNFVQELGDNGMMRTHAVLGGDNGTFGPWLKFMSIQQMDLIL